MQKITATFVTVTPMFLSGADQNKFELRGASFKGVLRFWWRTLAYARLQGDLSLIHDKENNIFGSADSGQGIFKIRVGGVSRETIINAGQILKHDNVVVGNGILYLGYGLMQAAAKRGVHEKGELVRPCVTAPYRFQVEFLFRNKTDPSVVDALKIFGLLGGLGSRTRRGFGSITLEKIEGDESWVSPTDADKYKKEIISVLNSPSLVAPVYTAFSKYSRITVLNSADDALSLLEDIGRKMQLYRSWGREIEVKGGVKKHMVGSANAEQNFFNDHKLAYDVADKGVTPLTHPDRIVFGLPHNYFLSHCTSRNGNKLDVEPKEHTRRASPFLIHVHCLGENNYVGVGIILQSDFLPKLEQITIKNYLECVSEGKKKLKVNKCYDATQKVDFGLLDKFIDGREGPRGAKTGPDYFPEREDIYP